jgi:hypothetical protein
MDGVFIDFGKVNPTHPTPPLGSVDLQVSERGDNR